MEEGEILILGRNSRKLKDSQNYIYVSNGFNGVGKMYENWKCCKWRNSVSNCKSRATTVMNGDKVMIKHSSDHNHCSNINELKENKLQREVVTKALENPGVAPREIYMEMAVKAVDKSIKSIKSIKALLSDMFCVFNMSSSTFICLVT